MKINPLAVFTGLTLVTFAALLYVEQKGGADERLITTAKVEPLAVPEAPKPAEPVKVEPTPVTKVEPAPSPPPPATEVAKIEEPAAIEPPKAAEPAKPAETAKIIPSFDTVRVEPTGEALIAGRAEPGSEVVVKFNGMTVGTAMTNADGAFVVTPDKPLPSGPGALSIESKSNEIVIASADSVAVDVKAGAVDTPLVAVLKPDEPTKVIQAPSAPKPALPPSKSVNLDTVDYDQTGNIVFGGRGPAGSKVQLYVDNNAYGLADINDKGTWSFAGLSPLTVGPHALRADEIGGNGAVKSRIEMPFYREEPTRVAAAPVAAAPAPANPVEVAEVEVAPAAATSTTESASTTTEAASTTTEAAATTTEAPETTTAEAPATTTTEVVKAPEPVPEAPANVEAPAEAPVVVAAQVPAAAEAAAAPTQVIIQPGNNLWKLSRQIYGRGMMYTVIYEANKDQIRKPSLIYPGQIFLTPEAAAATTGQ